MLHLITCLFCILFLNRILLIIKTYFLFSVQTIEVTHTQDDSLFPVALQALIGLAKSDGDTPEWEHTVFSAISSLLHSVSRLFFSLFSVLLSCYETSNIA
jgi:hypothetical protein